jgi:crossover junction endodeoxyribonuclease RuvC
MIVLGIDPGLTGAIAIIGHRAELLHPVADMPVMQRGAGNASVKHQVNAAALAELLHDWLAGFDMNEIRIFIEEAQSMPAVRRGRGGAIKIVQGGASIFSVGLTAGIIEGVVAARRYPHELVRPNVWKKAMKLTATKEQSRAFASRLYPEASLHRMKDHNRAEALLLAKYGHDLRS